MVSRTALEATRNFTKAAFVMAGIGLVAFVIDVATARGRVSPTIIAMLLLAALGFYATGAVARHELRRGKSARDCLLT